MKRLVLSGLAAGMLALMAGSANAAVTFTSTAFDAALAPGQHMAIDFDNPNAPGYSYTGTGGIFLGSDGLQVGIARPPFGDLSHYMAVQTGQTETLNTPILRSLSVYIGSLDTANQITFKGAGGFSQTFLGTDLGAIAQFGDDGAATTRRFYFNFAASDKVNQIVFTSGTNSFEFDSIGASAVPEPATWAMLLLGFGGIGFLLRNGRGRQLALRSAA